MRSEASTSGALSFSRRPAPARAAVTALHDLEVVEQKEQKMVEQVDELHRPSLEKVKEKATLLEQERPQRQEDVEEVDEVPERRL